MLGTLKGNVAENKLFREVLRSDGGAEWRWLACHQRVLPCN